MLLCWGCCFAGKLELALKQPYGKWLKEKRTLVPKLGFDQEVSTAKGGLSHTHSARAAQCVRTQYSQCPR